MRVHPRKDPICINSFTPDCTNVILTLVRLKYVCLYLFRKIDKDRHIFKTHIKGKITFVKLDINDLTRKLKHNKAQQSQSSCVAIRPFVDTFIPSSIQFTVVNEFA